MFIQAMGNIVDNKIFGRGSQQPTALRPCHAPHPSELERSIARAAERAPAPQACAELR
ncbi:hypothetical protein K523DRAFT_165510 [Schizophyllum commune Tattone D]|nr:hypothetical protein K523DRAFT_165510 [Schizophyllum commune Tattone D]